MSSAWQIYSSRPWLKHYDPGVPHDIEVPDVPLYKLLDDSAAAYPDNVAFHFLGRDVKYREFHSSALRFASYLRSKNIGKGDRVALFLPNSPQFAIAYYGSLYAGATVTPVNPLYTARELRFQLEDSEARILVALDLFMDKVKEGLPKGVETVVWTGIQDYLPFLKAIGYRLKFKPPSTPQDARNVKFTKIISESRPLEEKAKVAPAEDLAALMYTGGTTGSPKGVMLTHRNIVANVLQIDAWWFRGKKGLTYIGLLPWFHIYGQTAVLHHAIYTASRIITYPRPDIEATMKDIAKFKADIFHGVPTAYVAIINHPKVKEFDLRSLKACISGAAPLPVAVLEAFEKLTGAKLREGYGLTETSPVTHINPIEGKYRPGSIGLPVPSTYVAVADITSNEFLPPGQTGEIVVSGPQVMMGYFKRPEENSLAFFEAYGRRWFRTGDMGYMDEDGYFYIVDRKKDLIKYKGYSVFPREVEEVLYKHPCVKEVAVVGKPDPEAGEIPKAFIALKPECKGKTTAEEIIEYSKKNLAPFKVPREVEFREELPKTAVGKVLRRVLREEMKR
ncbi:MAG: long-chain fatty acid--CoA ligase [Acidilobaceae archaeon]|nr:long-chain fatty acid--CoA ligase [Acidilobaceae archaeon]MDW7973866.1 long-chain fatty acid--CoA ligase [Sulfolobales archaeon]